MATISAELLPDSAAVRLSITALSGIQSLVRRDSNGINDVRTLPGVLGAVPPTKLARRNEALDPSATNPVHWTNVGGAANTKGTATTEYHEGLESIRYTITGTGQLGGKATTGLALAAGDTVRWSVWVRPSVTIALQPYWERSGPTYAGGSGGAFVSCPANTWTKLEGALTLTAAQAGGTGYGFGVYSQTAWAVGDYFNLDEALVTVGTAALGTWFNGNTTDTDLAAYAWAGAANGSASTETVQESPTVVTDYEAAHGDLRYDLVNGDGALVSLDVAGFALAAPWLFTPVIPGFSRQLVRVDEVATGQPSASTVHDGLLGRADPIVIMRPPGTRRGTLKVYAGSYADARAVLDPLRQATVMMLRQPDHPGLDMYFAATDSEIIHETPEGAATTWGVAVSYVEVKRPEGPLAGALGWTYAALEGTVTRYSDLRLTYATYADMRLGKVKA